MLAKPKDKWYENKIKNKERIKILQFELSQANKDIDETNKALDELKQVQTINCGNLEFNREPQLSDFCKPSDEMKEYQTLSFAIIGFGSGYLIYKII